MSPPGSQTEPIPNKTLDCSPVSCSSPAFSTRYVGLLASSHHSHHMPVPPPNHFFFLCPVHIIPDEQVLTDANSKLDIWIRPVHSSTGAQSPTSASRPPSPGDRVASVMPVPSCHSPLNTSPWSLNTTCCVPPAFPITLRLQPHWPLDTSEHSVLVLTSRPSQLP